MEDTIIVYASLSLIFLLLAFKFHRSKTSRKNLPPGPPSLPILGNLHLLKQPTHRCFHKISQKYGPVFTFYLGNKRAVIVSSWSAAEECFTKNDVVLANRPPNTPTGKYMNYDHTTVTSAPYGDHWRNLRRIGAIEIFSTHRINMFLNVRKDETKRLLGKLSGGASRQGFAKVEMKSILSDLTFNVIMRMVSGKRYYGEDAATDKEEAREFKELIAEIFRQGGVGNAENFVPVLRWARGGKFEKRLKSLGERTDKFLQGLVDEHRNKEKGQEDKTNGTMIDHLLSLQETQPQDYSDVTIKGLVLVMLLAGTDTSAVTLEWAMSNLVNHPDVMKKVTKELDTRIGQERLIEEDDLPNLSYLHNIISETLRLYPSAPMLLPHYSFDDCIIGGYDVPRDTIVLINAWAIHRDPIAWEEPEIFKPERFDLEEKGGHKLMPFGLGRRACPGSGLAQRVVGLTWGVLIQCFEWKRIDEELVDMGEGTGSTMPKAQPLEVMCKARGIMNYFLTDVV